MTGYARNLEENRFFYRRHDRQHEFWLSSWSAFICRAIASSSLLIIDNRCTAECKFWIFLSYRELCTNRSSKRFNNAAVGQHMKSHTNKWLKVAIGSGVTQRSLWNLFFSFWTRTVNTDRTSRLVIYFTNPVTPAHYIGSRLFVSWFVDIAIVSEPVWTDTNRRLSFCAVPTQHKGRWSLIYIFTSSVLTVRRERWGEMRSGCTIEYYKTRTKNPIFFFSYSGPIWWAATPVTHAISSEVTRRAHRLSLDFSSSL